MIAQNVVGVRSRHATAHAIPGSTFRRRVGATRGQALAGPVLLDSERQLRWRSKHAASSTAKRSTSTTLRCTQKNSVRRLAGQARVQLGRRAARRAGARRSGEPAVSGGLHEAILQIALASTDFVASSRRRARSTAVSDINDNTVTQLALYLSGMNIDDQKSVFDERRGGGSALVEGREHPGDASTVSWNSASAYGLSGGADAVWSSAPAAAPSSSRRAARVPVFDGAVQVQPPRDPQGGDAGCMELDFDAEDRADRHAPAEQGVRLAGSSMGKLSGTIPGPQLPQPGAYGRRRHRRQCVRRQRGRARGLQARESARGPGRDCMRMMDAAPARSVARHQYVRGGQHHGARWTPTSSGSSSSTGRRWSSTCACARRRDDSKKLIISAKAAGSISTVAGGGAASSSSCSRACSSGRLPLRASRYRLPPRNDVCSDERYRACTRTGYYPVKGRGVLRIDVIGNQEGRSSWRRSPRDRQPGLCSSEPDIIRCVRVERFGRTACRSDFVHVPFKRMCARVIVFLRVAR